MENVPVLVCLPFGDKLYAEHMRQGKHLKEEERHPPVEYMRHKVKEQLSVCVTYLKQTIWELVVRLYLQGLGRIVNDKMCGLLVQ